jgi:DnaJ-class molecular chaperone
MRDPYQILGVAKSASDGDIKKAYRKLAKSLHPDRTKGDEAKQGKFSEVTQAYDLLSDKKKRAAYDAGEIDADGNPKFQGFDPFSQGAGRAEGMGGMGGAGHGAHGFETFRAEDIFSDLFGAMRGGTRTQPQHARGEDHAYRLAISFEQAVKGGKQRLTLKSGKQVDVKIEPGIEDGRQIRLKGQGGEGGIGGKPGDALITIKVKPHKLYSRDGRHIRLEVPITLYEAVLGGKIRVPTPNGPVELKIKPQSGSPSTLRLKGKGIQPAKKGQAPGDLLVSLRIVLPEDAQRELTEMMEKWAESQVYKPRGGDFGNN